MPTMLTIFGMSQIYFSGMAMPSKTKKEIPSKSAVRRSVRTNPVCFIRVCLIAEISLEHVGFLLKQNNHN